MPWEDGHGEPGRRGTRSNSRCVALQDCRIAGKSLLGHRADILRPYRYREPPRSSTSVQAGAEPIVLIGDGKSAFAVVLPHELRSVSARPVGQDQLPFSAAPTWEALAVVAPDVWAEPFTVGHGSALPPEHLTAPDASDIRQ